MDTRRQVSTVVVRGQDPLTRRVIEERHPEGAASVAPAGRRTGAQVRAAVLGRPTEWVVVDEPVTSSGEARTRAEALHDERAMEFVQGSGATLGLPGLRPGAVVTLDGVGPRFNGDHHVVRAMHSIGPDGYRTTFDVRRSWVGS
jgi:phage protein D